VAAPDYGPLYQAAGNKFQIDPLLLQSVAEHESDQDPNAVGKPVTLPDDSVQRARGLFQFMPDTAKQYNVDPTNPTSSAYGASNYLNDLLNQNNGNLRVALGIYSRTGPNSPYTNGVMKRYTGLHNAWTSGDPSEGATSTSPPASPPAAAPAVAASPGPAAGPGTTLPPPGSVPGPTMPPGADQYRGGLPPGVAFNAQGVPYNPSAVGAGAGGVPVGTPGAGAVITPQQAAAANAADSGRGSHLPVMPTAFVFGPGQAPPPGAGSVNALTSPQPPPAPPVAPPSPPQLPQPPGASALAQGPAATPQRGDPSDAYWPQMVHVPNFAERQPQLFGVRPGATLNDVNNPGWQSQYLTQVPIPGTNRTVTVNKVAADSFGSFLQDLYNRGYDLSDVEGFNPRYKTGMSGPLSMHAYGDAIDINPKVNAYDATGRLITNLPQNISEIAGRHGLTWGGDWTGTKDAMHFEFAGIDPTTGTDYRSGKPVQLAGFTPQGGGTVAQQQQPGQPAATSTVLSPEEKTLLGVGEPSAPPAPTPQSPQAPPASAAAAPSAATHTVLSPDEHTLLGIPQPPAASAPASGPTAPPRPAPSGRGPEPIVPGNLGTPPMPGGAQAPPQATGSAPQLPPAALSPPPGYTGPYAVGVVPPPGSTSPSPVVSQGNALTAPPRVAPAPPSVPPPIYMAPTTALIRPGVASDQSGQPMPAPTGETMPVWTPENQQALAGFEHGARQAVNPVLETGSAIDNWIAGKTGWNALTTNRVANDAAAEAAFQQQYGDKPIATGAARGMRVGLPLAMGVGTGAMLRTGLELAGLPQTAEFLSGAGGVGRPGVLGWGTRLASGATTGAVQGLVAGGAPGAATGAVLGGTVLPAIGGIANFVAGRTAQGAATNAVAAIYRAAARDNMTPAELEARVAQLGPGATLADVGGANLKQLAEGAANAPGPASEIAWKFLQQRAEGQSERMTQAVQDATGAQGSAYDNMEALKQARSQSAAPAYKAAFDNTVVTPEQSAELSRFVATPIGQRALQNGLTDIQLSQEVARGQPVDLKADYGVTQNADGSYELEPGAANLKLYDAVKRGYDSLVERFRDPTSGRLNLSGTTSVPGVSGEVSGNTLNDIRTAYTGTLRKLFPQYSDALDAWGGPSADMDALSMGKRLLSTDADQTAANVANLNPSQRQMYQVGVAQALRDRIESVPDAADATRRVFGNTQIRNRIAAGFGGESTPAFQNFQAIMEREAQFADTNRQLIQGSPTARRMAGIQEAQNPPLSLHDVIEPVGHVMTGNWPAAAYAVGRRMIPPVLNRLTTPSAAYSTELGTRLFNPDAATQAQNMLTGTNRISLRDWLMGPLGQQTGQLLFTGEGRKRLEGPGRQP
jgi:hypothetical protein